MILIVPEKKQSNYKGGDAVEQDSYNAGFNAAIDKIIQLNKANQPIDYSKFKDATC
ncbi:hypothetical protein UFOVP67_56 [uncultured Caudovirales phage]|uniref:Uncharacterized protein n=1 Tax=uncultured Caudovirales phage TaxID=2100421 RepID=A0A6J5TBS6_9CAUD|nr:hypothetical protein UFOVP67_56 [uncultured Caudovirales phage]